jgi:hypothetical protein
MPMRRLTHGKTGYQRSNLRHPSLFSRHNTHLDSGIKRHSAPTAAIVGAHPIADILATAHSLLFTPESMQIAVSRLATEKRAPIIQTETLERNG